MLRPSDPKRWVIIKKNSRILLKPDFSMSVKTLDCKIPLISLLQTYVGKLNCIAENLSVGMHIAIKGEYADLDIKRTGEKERLSCDGMRISFTHIRLVSHWP